MWDRETIFAILGFVLGSAITGFVSELMWMKRLDINKDDTERLLLRVERQWRNKNEQLQLELATKEKQFKSRK